MKKSKNEEADCIRKKNFSFTYNPAFAVAALAFILISLTFSGCSCGGADDDFKNIKHRESRTYEADAEEEGFRVKSRLASKSNLTKYYGSGIDIMKRREKSQIIEKLQFDGGKALKNKDFRQAESLFSEGKYQEALKYYNSAGAAGNNIYIERRALACKVSIDRVSARENEDMKKAHSLLTSGRPTEAVNILESIERQNSSSKEGVYLKQSVSSLKIKAYSEMGDNKKLIEEYIKQDKLSGELSETLSKSWTIPIE
jgi:tetratricopeptide (TPR) repeat protein